MSDVSTNDSMPSNTSSSLSIHTIPADELDTDIFDYDDDVLQTPAHYYARLGSLEGIREQIEKGAELNTPNNKGETPLHIACRFGHADIVELLLATPTVVTTHATHIGENALHVAAKHQHDPALFQVLLDSQQLPIDSQTPEGRTPLSILCASRRTNYAQKLEIAKLMFESGADPNPHIFFDCFPVPVDPFKTAIRIEDMGNVTDDYLELVALFLYYDASVDKYDAFQKSAFMFSLIYAWESWYGQRSQEVKYTNMGADDIYRLELFKPHREVINMLFDYVADFNEIGLCYIIGEDDVCYCSMINVAIMVGCDRIKDMISRGGDVNYCTKKSSSLTISASWSDSRLFNYLWWNCDLAIIVKLQQNFLIAFINCCRFEKDDFVETVHFILSSEHGDELLINAVPQNVYTYLVRKFKSLNIPKNARLGIIYRSLELYNKITTKDLLYVYKTYGFNEELEAFMNVTVELLNFVPYNKFLMSICYPQYVLKTKLLEPKTLLELSRDVIRRNVKPVHKFGTKNVYFAYYYWLNRLELPEYLKKIVLLKSPLAQRMYLQLPDLTYRLSLSY